MKRHGNLMQRILTYSNIENAFDKAIKHKTRRRNVQRCLENKPKLIMEIMESLRNKTFHTATYHLKTIYEPKQRIIYILPFYPDRIVQHAAMNIISPIWDKMLIADTYSCRVGKGQHAACRKLRTWLRGNDADYVLKCDVSKFYPSINHAILIEIIEHKIKDPDVLWLLGDIINSADGLTNVPIGNYTSQWFGNLYLNELDVLIKHKYKVKQYLRYCDDFLLISKDKGMLKDLQQAIPEFLEERLQLHMSKNELIKATKGIDFLGYRHFNGEYTLLRKRTARQMKKKMKRILPDMYAGKITPEQALSKVGSCIGWLKHADTYRLQKSYRLGYMIEEIQFYRKQQKQMKEVLKNEIIYPS